jgi:hypothetical protein
MVQVIEQLGNISGRIGKGFAQGLSEQLPKEIQRSRLAQGLENLSQNQENLNPLQQLAQLSRSGLDPSQIAQFIPYLQQLQQKQAYINKGQGVPGQGNAPTQPPQFQGNIPSANQQPSAAPSQAQPSAPTTTEVVPSKLQQNGLASPSQIQEYKQNILQPPTFHDIQKLATDYLASGITNDVAQAQQMANTELTQNRASQQARNTELRNNLSQRMALDLQKGGLGNFGDVAGEIQQRLLDQGEYLVNRAGLSPEAASNEISRIINQLGKTATNTKTTGSVKNWFTPTNTIVNQLKDQRKEFSKYGFEEQFDDLATGEMGITPTKIASVLDPIKNSEVNQVLGRYKKGVRTSTEEMKSKDMDALIRSIKPTDNLLSIENELREKFLDIDQFKERLSQLEDENQIALTDRQVRQRNKPISNYMYGDFWFDARRGR